MKRKRASHHDGDLKKGTHIRFNLVNYDKYYRRVETTGEVTEGTVIRREGDGYVVRVDGQQLPFYVKVEDILGEET